MSVGTVYAFKRVGVFIPIVVKSPRGLWHRTDCRFAPEGGGLERAALTATRAQFDHYCAVCLPGGWM